MSDWTSKLNMLVLGGLAVVAFYIFSQPRQTTPPSNAWFLSEVINRPEPVLVKFGAEWCGPCRMLEPQLDRVAGDLGGRVSVVRVDVGKQQDLAQHYGISSIPRLLLFQHGQIVGDRVGYANHQQLKSWVLSHAQP